MSMQLDLFKTEPTEEPDSDDELPAVDGTCELGQRYEMDRHTIYCADCVDVMRGTEPESVDAVVCDPPYGLEFMGKEWDRLGAVIEHPDDGEGPWGRQNRVRIRTSAQSMQAWHEGWAKEALRVLKPGGHLIAFGGTRTVHRLACALEDVGFEIRDTISWIQFQGFPKSHDVSKAIDRAAGVEREVVGIEKRMNEPSDIVNIGQGARVPIERKITRAATDDAKRWDGWGTGLKPAQEPAILARKPLIGTVAENVLKHGTGALNIDACRYRHGDTAWPGPNHSRDDKTLRRQTEQSGYGGGWHAEMVTRKTDPLGRWPANIYQCSKASRKEREAGCENLARARKDSAYGDGFNSATKVRTAEQAEHGVDRGTVSNTHATVKPVRLMRWLVRLVTQPGGLVLDPFLGSGTTMIAAEREGFRCIGIEREPDYCAIALARVGAVCYPC